MPTGVSLSPQARHEPAVRRPNCSRPSEWKTLVADLLCLGAPSDIVPGNVRTYAPEASVANWWLSVVLSSPEGVSGWSPWLSPVTGRRQGQAAPLSPRVARWSVRLGSATAAPVPESLGLTLRRMPWLGVALGTGPLPSILARSMTPEAVFCAKRQHKDAISGPQRPHVLRHDRQQSPPCCPKIMLPDRATLLPSRSRVLQVSLILDHFPIIPFLVRFGGLVVDLLVFTAQPAPIDSDPSPE